MENGLAFKMLEARFSEHVKTFNHYPVSGEDSDAQYDAVKERVELARAALERAPKIRVTTPARSYGDILIAVKRHMTPEERQRWDALLDQIESLSDKYGI